MSRTGNGRPKPRPAWRRAPLLCALLLAGCPSPDPPPEPPLHPVPMAALNTEWDDYNAAPDPEFPDFVWSTNRGSGGGDFDIWHADVVFPSRGGADVLLLEDPAPVAGSRSSADELGPIHHAAWGPTDVAGEARGQLVFASDRAGGRGGLDLHLLDEAGVVTALGDLNTAANEAYWTFLGGDHAPAYLASDRGGGGTDIYRITGPDGTEAPLGGPGAEIAVETALSSPEEDTAPFLFRAWDEGLGLAVPHVVFASDRAGGAGGFDLWCSRYANGRWEEPRNLGSRVNTTRDEFRPSVSAAYGILVFSSNRAGGKGGFDLYYARWMSPF